MQEFWLKALTVVFVLGLTYFMFWLRAAWIRRNGGFITNKDLREKTASKVLVISSAPLEELESLRAQLESEVQSAREKYNKADIGGPSDMVIPILFGNSARLKRQCIDQAEAYNDYVETHEYLKAVERLIRARPDRWKPAVHTLSQGTGDDSHLKAGAPPLGPNGRIPPNQLKRVILPPDELEDLCRKIDKEYVKMGKGELMNEQEKYERLATNSSEWFGIQLSSKQVEGKHTHWLKNRRIKKD